jgi:hypothetical protein
MCVLEATLFALCERCADGEGDDYIISVLLSAVITVRTAMLEKYNFTAGYLHDIKTALGWVHHLLGKCL